MKLLLFILFIISLTLGCSVAIKKSSFLNTPVNIIYTSKVVAISNLKSTAIKGVAVDSHGRALDTDGDGIPDYKDKELLTSQVCFPVDSTGMGVCPDPPCCFVHGGIDDPFPSCIIEAVNIVFGPKSKVLTPAAKQLLVTFADQIAKNPHCKIRLGTISYLKKADIDLSWQRVNAIARFLVESEGISEGRISFGLHLGGENVVELVGEDDRFIIPAPPPKRRQ